MNFSEYSLLMAVVWSDVLILLAYLLRSRLWFARAFGLKTLLVFFCGCAFRLLVSVELLPAVEIRVLQLNCVGDFFRNSLPLGGYQFPVSVLLLFVWFSVSVIKIVRVFITYCRDLAGRRSLPGAGPEVERCLLKIIPQTARGKIHVVASPQIDMPCVAGIRYGIICLPERTWKKKELRLILKHESIHFKNHDVLIYLLVNLFCAFFWWNPCVYLLQRHVQEILEFKVDAEILSCRNRAEAIYYCRTLVKFAGKANRPARCFFSGELERRVSRILDEPFSARNKVLCGGALLLFSAGLLALSYMVIFQPYFTPKLEDEWHVLSTIPPPVYLEMEKSTFITTPEGHFPITGNGIIRLREAGFPMEERNETE